MTTEVTTVSVRLPASLKAAIEEMAAAGGLSVDQFLTTAAAEKLSALRSSEAFFAARKGQADTDAAIRFLGRSGGAPPLPGDEMPD